jgi:hypothetical protein
MFDEYDKFIKENGCEWCNYHEDCTRSEEIIHECPYPDYECVGDCNE